MPTTSSDRYSAVSSSSASSNSSTNCYNNPNSYSLSQSSTFLPLRSATSSLHLCKLNNTDYRSMQTLKIQQQYQTNKISHTPIARVSPRVINHQLSLSQKHQRSEFNDKDENWLSCEELENIEKRFTDLLQETTTKKSLDYQQHEKRAKSCDRLAIDEQDYKPITLTSKWR
jgi:hypothetical protein